MQHRINHEVNIFSKFNFINPQFCYFLFFLKFIFSTASPLHFHMNFRANLSISSKKKVSWDFDWHYFDSAACKLTS